MRNHLSPSEFVEFVDATGRALPASRSAHLEGCARCRARLAAVREALAAAEAVDVPEPSPLYWPHMAARVRDRVAGETPRAGSWHRWLALPMLIPVVSALAIVVAVFIAGQGSGRQTVDPQAMPPARAAIGSASTDPTIDADSSEAWQVLTSAAAEMPIEDAHDAGMAVAAGAVDRAVQRMTPEEVNELGQLLRSEIHHSGD